MKAALLLGMLAVAGQASGAEPSQVPERPDAPPPEVAEPRDARPEYHYHQDAPEHSSQARPVEFDADLFKSDPTYDEPYSVAQQIQVYGGKTGFRSPRPLLELGYPLYSGGALGQTYNLVGEKNLLRPQLLVYGDLRTATSFADNNGGQLSQAMTRLNLDIDLKLTATERIHAFVRPLDDGVNFTKVVFDDDDRNISSEVVTDFAMEALFFEGDLGAIQSGLTDEYASYDLPIAFGRIPMVLQNGIWMEDAFDGFAISRTAQNSPRFDITNFDVTLFAGFNELTTDALRDPTRNGVFAGRGGQDTRAGQIYGITTFMDVQRGYLEAGWAYIRDTQDFDGDQSYHSLALAFTKRYWGRISNSVRVIASVGQDVGDADPGFLGRPDVPANFEPFETADGVAILIENSLITHLPSTLIPYFNFWVGFDRPLPAARLEGLLKNTGINFENDGMGGFPILDDSANDTFGGAVGIEYLFALNQQIVVEVATVQTMGSDADRNARGDQYALGVRWQKPINDRWILRADAMYGSKEDEPDIKGIRLELRRKF